MCGAFCEARNVVRKVSRRGSLFAIVAAGAGAGSSSPVRKLNDGWFVLRTAMAGVSLLFVVPELG